MQIFTLSVAALLAGAGAGRAATFQAFDLPSGAPTCGTAIASDGTVIGNPVLSVGSTVARHSPPSSGNTESFVYRNGTFTFPQPVVSGTSVTLTGINAQQALVGFGVTISPAFQFTYTPFKLKAGVTKAITLPGGTLVEPTALNNAGDIAGTFQPANATSTRGFLLQHGSLTVLDDGSGDPIPLAMTENGSALVGISLGLTNPWYAWTYAAGVFTPLSALDALIAFPSGIDRAGRITGTYIVGAYPSQVNHGFLYANGALRTLDVPGATSTSVFGLNGHGQFTGCFTDAKGTHGLLGQL